MQDLQDEKEYFSKLVYSLINGYSQIILYSIIGYWLAKSNVITKANIKLISYLLENVLTPSLIFSNFIESFQFYNINNWVPYFITHLLIFIFGITFGYLCVTYFYEYSVFNNLFIIGHGIVHVTSFPIIVVEALYPIFNIHTPSINNYSMGIHIIIINNIINNALRWKLGLSSILKCQVLYDNLKIQDDTSFHQYQIKVNTDNKIQNDDKQLLQYEQENKWFIKKIYKLFQDQNIPIKTSLISILICSIVPLQNNFNDPYSLLHNIFYKNFNKIGKTYSLMTFLQLGANIYFSEQSSVETIPKVILKKFIITKLIIQQILGTIIVFITVKIEIIQYPIEIFIYYLMVGAPLPIQFITMAENYSSLSREIATIVKYQFYGYFFILPFVLIIFFIVI